MPAPSSTSRVWHSGAVRGPTGTRREKSGRSWFRAAEVGTEKTLVAQIFFQTSERVLDSEDRRELQKLVELFKPLMDAGECIRFEFEGHADKRYREDYNQRLSEDRAASVHAFAAGQIPALSNALVVGRGVEFAGNDLAQDRRVDVFVSRAVRRPAVTSLVIVVVDSRGNAVQNASVRVADRSETFRTSADGIVRIANIDRKKVVVTAWKAEYTEENGEVAIQPGVENRYKIKLRSQVPADLPVRVTDHRGRPIAGATVTAEPVHKTYGSYETLSGKTDNLGECYFSKIRHNTYRITAAKDGMRSDTKQVAVNQPGMNAVVRLTINTFTKRFEVRVASARWYKASKPGRLPGIGILGLDVNFAIRDLEKGTNAEYCASLTTLEITWGSPWSSGRTTGPGTARQFEAWRTTYPDERTFAGPAQITVYSIGNTMKFDLQFPGRLGVGAVNVSGLAVGPNTDPIPGLEWTTGRIQLVLQ